MTRSVVRMLNVWTVPLAYRFLNSSFRKRAVFLFVIFMIAAVAAVTLLQTRGGETAQQANVAKPAIVQVVHPQKTKITRYLEETGTAAAFQKVMLQAQVPGTLQEIRYQDGQKVREGQVLFVIDPSEYKAKVDQAEAEVRKAQATLVNAEKAYARSASLSRASAVSKATADADKASLDIAKGDLASAQANLDLARLDLSHTQITAPFAGFVTAHEQDIGAQITTSSDLATIMSLDPIHVDFTVPEEDALRLRRAKWPPARKALTVDQIHLEAGTRIDGGYPLSGYLDYVDAETATNTAAFRLRAYFANADRTILPGMYLHIRIPIGQIDDAMLVPAASIGTDQQGQYVLAVSSDGRLERRQVTLLPRDQDGQPVQGELTPTDKVVANVMSGVSAGENVTTELLPSHQNQTTSDR